MACNTRVFWFIILVVAAAYLSFLSFKQREYDWDLPGYVGCIFENNGTENAQSIHQKTYNSIQSEASKLQFDNLIAGNSARAAFYNDKLAFIEQLPYYQIKVGYNFITFLFYRAGFSAPVSVLLPNAMFYFLSVMALYFISRKIFTDLPFLALVISLGIAVLPSFRHISTTASPDVLIILLSIIFASQIILKSAEVFKFLVIFLMVLTRPDFILFVLTYYLLILIIQFKEKRKVNFQILIFVSVILVSYLFILSYFNYPGWKAVFYDSFIYRRHYISREIANFTFGEYIEIIFSHFINFKKITLISTLLLVSILKISKDSKVKCYAMFFYANLFLKFLFFPAAAESRFFLPFIFPLIIFLLYSLSFYQNKFKLYANRIFHHSRN